MLSPSMSNKIDSIKTPESETELIANMMVIKLMIKAMMDHPHNQFQVDCYQYTVAFSKLPIDVASSKPIYVK